MLKAPIKSPARVNAGAVAIGKVDFLMRFSFYLVLVLIVLAVPSGASAVVLVNPDGTRAEPYQTWVEGFDIPAYEITVAISTDTGEASCLANGYAYACVEPGLLYVLPMCGLPPSEYQRDTCRTIIAHEIGHVYQSLLTDATRKRFARIVGREFWDESWTIVGGIEEIWADRFAACALNRRTIRYRYSNGRRMWGAAQATATPRQHRRICWLVGSLAPS